MPACQQRNDVLRASRRPVLQQMITDGTLLGSSKSVDEVVAVNARLMTALRAVVADRDGQLEERIKQTEAELRPQLEVRGHTAPAPARSCSCAVSARLPSQGCFVFQLTKEGWS